MRVVNDNTSRNVWLDDNGNPHYGERPVPEKIPNASESPILNKKGNEVYPSSTEDPLDWYYRLITDMRTIQNGFTNDQLDAYGNNILQLIIRQQDWQRQSPAVQLQRLMATGMSRAAAMDLLKSAGGGDGGGSSVTPQMAGNVEQSQNERINAISNAVNTSVQSLSMLINSAVNLGTAIPAIQTQFQQLQIITLQREQMAYETSQAKMQFDALQDVGAFVQTMQNYQDRTGKELPADLNEAINALRSVKYEDMPDVFSMANDRFNKSLENPYFYCALRKAHENFVKGNYELGLELQRDVARTELAGLNNQKMHNDILAAWQSFQNAIKQGSLTDEQIRNAQAAYKETLLRYGLIKAEKRRANAAASLDEANASLASENYDFTTMYLHPVQIKQLMGELTIQNSLHAGGYYKNIGYSKLRDSESAWVLAQVAAMQAADYRSFYEDADDLYKLQYNLKTLGIIDYNVQRTSHNSGINVGIFKDTNNFEGIQITPPSAPRIQY